MLISIFLKTVKKNCKLINLVTGDVELYCDNRAAIDFSKSWIEAGWKN